MMGVETPPSSEPLSIMLGVGAKGERLASFPEQVRDNWPNSLFH